ncbi:hemerythrin domain-containing protein [Mesorhizobium amorphae]
MIQVKALQSLTGQSCGWKRRGGSFVRREWLVRTVTARQSLKHRAVVLERTRPKHPALVIQRVHDDKLALCMALEKIADALPNDVCRAECLHIASLLLPLLRKAHAYEEDVIFPAFAVAGTEANPSVTIRRLRAEHVEDESFADEVTEILLAVGHGEPVGNAEALGFMLRGLFETLRRHIAFEREHVLPAIIGN